jgi:RNA polymerase sigma-70 factor (ECF subfamily)
MPAVLHISMSSHPHPDRARAGPASEPPAPLPQAFETLFRAEYPRVVAIAQRVLGERDTAEDVAQDVFLAYHRRHPAQANYAGAWLHAAAVHTALNAVRSRRRRERREQAHAIADPKPPLADPAETVSAAETRREVRDALGRLPERSSSVLALRYSGLSYAEVADALGIRVSQVGTRLRRAEARFRKEVNRAPSS